MAPVAVLLLQLRTALPASIMCSMSSSIQARSFACISPSLRLSNCFLRCSSSTNKFDGLASAVHIAERVVSTVRVKTPALWSLTAVGVCRRMAGNPLPTNWFPDWSRSHCSNGWHCRSRQFEPRGPAAASDRLAHVSVVCCGRTVAVCQCEETAKRGVFENSLAALCHCGQVAPHIAAITGGGFDAIAQNNTVLHSPAASQSVDCLGGA